MKRIALLSFIIGLLGVPIQAQAADPSEELQMFIERQKEVAKTLSSIAEMRHRMMKLIAENLREPEQNAAPPIQYYPAPPTQYYAPTNCVPLFTQNSDPEAGVRYLFAHPGTRVCPGPHTDPAETARILQNGAAERAAAGRTLRCSISGHVC
jgi:hypothetical protein